MFSSDAKTKKKKNRFNQAFAGQLGCVQKYLSRNILRKHILSFLFSISFCGLEILENSIV